MSSSSPENRSFCNACQHATRHVVLSTHSRQYREGDGELSYEVAEEWKVMQCKGCETIKACVKHAPTGTATVVEIHYPPMKSRSLPPWARQLPAQFHDIIREVYDALNTKCPCLCMMGTRTLIDEMLTDMLGDIGGFAIKLNEAVKGGLLTETQRETIEAAVEAGHAASHRRFRPTLGQVLDTLDIVEHALKDGYVIKVASGRLAASVPPRLKGVS